MLRTLGIETIRKAFTVAAMLICVLAAGQAQNGSNYIIQNTGGYAADVRQFESDNVQAYLTLHNLPSTDAALLYQYGRQDLRTELRSFMYVNLGKIISTPAASRTTHQQNIYNWFEGLVYQNEVAEYKSATTEFQRFLSNKCGYQLDSTVATAYNLSYSGSPFCWPNPLIDLFYDPPTPGPDYYLAFGLKNSYNAPLAANPKAAVILGQTQQLNEANLGYAVLPGAAAAGATYALYATSVIAPFAFRAFAGGAAAVTDAVDIGLASAAEASGPLLIVTLAAAIAVQAGMQVVQQDQQAQQIAAQQTYYNNLVAHCNSVDLNAFLNDSSGTGGYKLLATWTAATLPDVPSTTALPARTTGTDAVFAQPYPNAQTYTALHYKDWNGIQWTVSFWGNYFIQYQTNAPSMTSFTPTIQVDEKGDGTILYTATRVGVNFLITPQTAPSNAQPCPASATTGLSAPGSSMATCASYVGSYIIFTDPTIGYNSAWAPLNQPTFATTGAVTFADGTAQTVNLQATAGNVNFAGETGQYTLVGTLPPHFSQTTTASGIAIKYDGSADANLPGTYNLGLQVLFGSGGTGAAPYVSNTAQLAITVKPGDAIITQSQTITAYVGDSVNYQISTSGHPNPVISLVNVPLPSGLTFVDNRNGTASISGAATAPETSSCAASAFCGIETDYGARQPLQVTVAYRTSPAFTSASSWTFTNGVPGTFAIATSGSSPTAAPVANPGQPKSGVPAIFASSNPFSGALVGAVTANTSVQHPVASASWLSFKDNGNGTATLSGTPPSGAGDVTLYLESVYANSLPSLQQLTLVSSNDPVVITPGLVTLNLFTTTTIQVQAINITESSIVISAPIFGTLTLSNGTLTVPSISTGGLYFANFYTTAAGTVCSASTANVRPTRALFTENPASATDTPLQLLQTLQLEVDQAPAITSAATVNFFQGIANQFAVTTSGFPEATTVPNSTSGAQAMRVTLTGTLPNGVAFTDLNQAGQPTGTGILSGTPSTGGVFPLTLSANNGVGSPATQNFTLIVKNPGDVNGDGVVNCQDVAEVKASFGLYSGQTGFDTLADVNHDGAVNVLDLAAVTHYLPTGTRCQ